MSAWTASQWKMRKNRLQCTYVGRGDQSNENKTEEELHVSRLVEESMRCGTILNAFISGSYRDSRGKMK
jgi:fructose-bisphosphate aldolase class 1